MADLLLPRLMNTVPESITLDQLIIHFESRKSNLLNHPRPGIILIDFLAIIAACLGKILPRYNMSTKLSISWQTG